MSEFEWSLIGGFMMMLGFGCSAISMLVMYIRVEEIIAVISSMRKYYFTFDDGHIGLFYHFGLLLISSAALLLSVFLMLKGASLI